VRDCLLCSIELREQRSLGAAVAAQPTIHTSSGRDFDRLLAQLDGASAQRRGTSRARAWVAAPRTLSITAVATVAIIAVAALVVALPQLFDERVSNDFVTLTDVPEAGAAAAVQFDLIFVESLSADERQRVLDELGATVVAGPSALGRYRVQLASVTGAAEDALTNVLAKLAADSRIRFVGRAFDEVLP
jgi:hypothetical protein